MLLILQHIYNEVFFHHLNKKEGSFGKQRKRPNFCLNWSLWCNKKGVFLVYYKYIWLIYSFIFKRKLGVLCMNGCEGYRKMKCFPNGNQILQQAATGLNICKKHWYQKVLFPFTKVDPCYLKTWCWICVTLHCEIIFKTPGGTEEQRWLKCKVFTRTGKENSLQKTLQQYQRCLCNPGKRLPLGRSLCRGWYPKIFASPYKEAAKQSHGMDKSLGPQHGLHHLRK